jgi:hypothetical protein
MLSNRMFWAEIRGVCSTMMMVCRGRCAQGGVLSPLLWNMDINSLLGKSLWAQGFAEDIAIVTNF